MVAAGLDGERDVRMAGAWSGAAKVKCRDHVRNRPMNWDTTTPFTLSWGGLLADGSVRQGWTQGAERPQETWPVMVIPAAVDHQSIGDNNRPIAWGSRSPRQIH